MTITTRDYYTLRPLLANCDDSMQISRRAVAVFWMSGDGWRLLLFVDGDLRWTQWYERRHQAIDAALEGAKWHEEHVLEPF